MTNGIYLDINSADDWAQMEENRAKMHKVKVWTEWTVIIEIISAVYLAFASFLGFLAIPAGLLYIYLLTRKDPKICRIGTFVHIGLMAVAVIGAAAYLITTLTMGPDSISFLPGGLTHLVTSVPAEDLNNDAQAEILKIFMRSMIILTSLNLVCSIVVTAAPVWMNYKEYDYCLIHEELKNCTGYPHFHPDTALMKAAEEIAEKKNHKIQNDTDGAVANDQLMKKLRDQNIDFKDTDALFSAITENTHPEKKTSSDSAREALEKVDAMLTGARNSNKYTTSAMNSIIGAIGSSVTKTTELFDDKKPSPNAAAMNELLKEAERLRAKKAYDAGKESSPFKEQMTFDADHFIKK